MKERVRASGPAPGCPKAAVAIKSRPRIGLVMVSMLVACWAPRAQLRSWAAVQEHEVTCKQALSSSRSARPDAHARCSPAPVVLGIGWLGIRSKQSESDNGSVTNKWSKLIFLSNPVR